MTAQSSLDELVARQVRRWELERRLPGKATPPPCIALSRHPHSGAAEIGLRVAEKLDYGFFGIEILDRVARESGIQRQLLEGVDERVRNAVRRNVTDAFRAGGVNEDEYIRAVVRTLATLGEQGRAVLLGRGSPFVLEPERTLRVLVVAPPEQRAARLARTSGLSESEARAELAREDRERRRFLEHHFHVDPNDPLLYDLVLNTAQIGLDGAVDTILHAHRLRFS